MTDEQIALARRAVACKGWRWREGMLTQRGARVLVSEDDGRYVLTARRSWKQPALMEEGETPDLTDPATLGCLLALVREAWSQPLVTVRWSVRGWSVVNTDGRPWCWRIGRGATEAEALVVALEAAP